MNMNGSLSDQYIKRISSTVLALTKILEGASAGFALFMLFRLISPVIGELSKGAMDLNQLLQIIVSEYGVQDAFLQEYSGIMIGSLALPFIIYGGILLLTVVALLLVVIETVALLALRFAKAGAGFVKVIHQIYMGVCIIHLIMFAYTVFEYIRNRSAILKTVEGSEAAVLGIDISMGIIAVIYLIVLLLHLCYHKDIARAMKTVGYEIETETQGYFKRTHLSGISFLFGLPYVLLIFFNDCRDFEWQPGFDREYW